MKQNLQQLQSRADYVSAVAYQQAAHVLFPAFAQSVYRSHIPEQLTAFDYHHCAELRVV